MSEQQNSLQTIFVEALEIEDAQKRAAFLSRACGTDSVLRREVEDLIQAHAAAGKFLPDQPAVTRVRSALWSTAQALGPGGSAASIVPVSESPGDRIGRYKLLQRIGEGGCGVVYMAEQEEPVRRRVALKVIKLGMDTKNVIARFEAERQALALMDHSNIAKVLDGGATDSGRPYFVMELVRGTKITEYCDENELSTRERLELFIQVCLAVQHAHQKGIIHRDLKPSNILVTVNDARPVPKVIDFGIAKATDGRLTDHTLFTAFDQFLGTPAYMSPEQTVMTSQDIDTRSDIYSLGVLLYELLTGKTPFDTKELLASGLDELRRTIREKEPMRPSTRLKSMAQKELTTTAKHRRSEAPKLIHLLRGDLDAIVGKCLEKDRARRYETASGLAMDITRHLAGEPVVARPPSAVYRLGKVARRNKLAFTAGIAIVAVLLIGTAVSRWQAVRVERERQQLHRNVVRQYVANGTRLVNEGDLFSSLLWYAKALELDAGDPRREEPHRIRIASLLRQCPKLLSVFSHGNNLCNSEFSADGGRLVTASDDHTARVWDVATGQQLLLLRHDDEVQDARFSQNGLRVVTSGRDKTARIWDSRTGTMLQLLPHRGIVSESCFSPDGRLVATACEDHTVQLWDAATGTRVGNPLEHKGPVGRVIFSPDGRLLGSTTMDLSGTTAEHTASIWEVATGRKMGEYPHTTDQTGLAFSPDSQRLLTCEGSNLRIWDTATFGEVAFSPIRYASICDFCFSPDGHAILVASDEFTAQTWDAATGRPLFSPGVQHVGPITGARVSPDGRSFVTAGNDAIARVWSTATGQPLSPPFRAILMIKQAHFNADGRRLLMKSCDKAARVWDLATGDLPGPARPIFENEQRLISPNGRLILRGGQSNIVWIADTQTGQNLAPLPHRNGVAYASFSRDGRTVLTASEWNTDELFLWDAPSGRRLNTVNMSATYRVLYAAFSPDNARLLTCGLDYCGYLWNAHTGQPLSDHPLRHRNRVTWGSFSPDGRSVVTASWDKTARVWDAATGDPLTPPLQHNAVVVGAAWNSDGKRLLTVTTDDHLQVWDLTNSEPLTPPRKIQESKLGTDLSRSLASNPATEDLPRDDRPVADLVLLSQMLAVGRIDSGGNVVPLQLHELTHASKELRQKYPGQFAASSSEVAEWHRRQARQSRGEGNLKAAMFHSDRVLDSRPDDLALAQERIELAAALASGTHHNAPHQSFARRIPPRERTAREEQIDLSQHYNLALQDFNFAGLPTGLQTLGGCRFDIRGLVHVYGRAFKGEEQIYPEVVQAIGIARKCHRLHFLQATSYEVADGVQVGSYVLHYADGERLEVPLVYGRDLANWWFWGLPRGSSESAFAAWVGQNPDAAKNGAGICLYKSTRENPRPEVELVSIDFVSNLSFAAPFLVALTVE